MLASMICADEELHKLGLKVFSKHSIDREYLFSGPSKFICDNQRLRWSDVAAVT